MASSVVSGVGFLGAGLIFKNGWERPRAAAIGVLSGRGAPRLALVLAVGVILTNTVLRPLAYRLHPALILCLTT